MEAAVTPRHSMFGQGGKSPYIKSGLVRPTVLSPEGRGTPRQIFTPLFGGRKYARAHIDMGSKTPQRAAVSRTPFTARRGISEYVAEKDPIKTYIRLKPADPQEYQGVVPKSLLQVVSDKEVEMSRGLAEDGSVAERYLFAGVLPSLAKQPRVFEVCAMPVVKDLLSGFNTLLFSYGITNSGKTYTVQGTSDAPGMLPRSVKTILDVLDARGLQGDFAVRPRYATQVEYCSDQRVVAPTFRVAPGEDAWVRQFSDMGTGDPRALAELVQELDAGDEAGDEWVYQLYVSYFEVYNEMIYDLLDLTTLTTVHVKPAAPVGGKRGRGKRVRGRRVADDGDPLMMSAAQIAGLPRSALLLRSEGGRGNEAFVEGAVEVRVRNVRDLVRVLVHGQMRRSVHATGLNAGSSRSHAVFQAKLVKLRRGSVITPLAPIPSEARASVRGMTIVDLAGSERAKRTLNSGERLAEAGKINVSLMTLKKCLDVRRFNAVDGNELVPYNESKITRLFQPALEGGAKTIMVVCIDPYEHTDIDALSRASMAGPSQSFTETKNVLDFARVASELVTRVRRVEDPPLAAPLETMAGGGSSDEDEEEEDEIFFDTDAEGESSALDAGGRRKRAGSVMCVDVGVQTDDEPKRQRRDLGGNWQHPPSTEPLSPARADAVPFSPVRAAATVAGPTALNRDSAFSFEAPMMIGSALRQPSNQVRGGSLERENAAHRALAAQAAETNEVVAYAEALEAGVEALRAQAVAAQERVLRIEEETRAEVSSFFMAKLADVKRAAAERLADELARSEERAAHKIDILSRLRGAESSDSDTGAEVPTVSPRTAVRRAVSRAASKKANKVASVSAGENSELARLRTHAESLEGHIQAQATELDLLAQVRAADRHRLETLEVALVDANERAATAEAKLMRLTASNSAAAELAQARQHERERAEMLAQTAQLKSQLREAETQARAARRAWETQELLPLQERLRVLVAAQANRAESSDEALDRACKDRDSAWAWWTREQERCSQLCAQNDVLMREIRHLRGEKERLAEKRPPSSNDISGDDDDDDDDGFCKISLRSVASATALNGASAEPPAIAELDRVAAKARVLVRVPKPGQPSMPPRESEDSLGHVSPPGAGRAKRVVSRVFQHFAPDARPRPYLAGRFANTDTAVGCYSAEVFSYEDNAAPLPPAAGRPRGATAESLDTAVPKVRSIVYSGPIVSHATGGVSVTFTSQAVRDLPLATTAENIPEEDEDEESAHRQSPASSVSPQGTKRVHATMYSQPTLSEHDDDHMEEDEEEEEDDSPVGIESALMSAAKNKKKRRLHAAHTVIDIGGSSPASNHDSLERQMPTYVPLAATSSHSPLASRVSKAAMPQESKQPVLFTPVRTRSKNRLPTDVSPTAEDNKNESIFLTPMKMLNRLRHRKK
ncbi:hypothetical protein GGI20_002027 [Coemansia sp. BCRC 34301]|nr:hypothetical protein GGI20_002027 [Coemansia sp. BCRC 34301]